MKIVFIGTVDFSARLLKSILNIKEAEVVGIITKSKSNFNSDFYSLDKISIENNIPFLYYEETNEDKIESWIKSKNPDVIYCLGWSHLLKKNLLSIPKIGTVGYHPAALPQNRGRHPIIWALALGLKSTASTFFFMDEGADSGDILNQEFIEISEKDNAKTLYNKLAKVAISQIQTITVQLATKKYKAIPQEHNYANYWRKRSKKDGEIDWRMDKETIYNTVRALTKPYVGAHCNYQGEEVKVWATSFEKDDSITEIAHIEPGKILGVENNVISIKCSNGIIHLLDHDFIELPKVGTYL